MTDVVEIAHPAYVTFLRPRAQRPVTGCLRVVTPVAIPEVDPDGFARPGRMRPKAFDPYPFEPWIRDGAAWRPIRVRAERGEYAKPVAPDEFRRWLRGEAEPASPAALALDDAFDGTPISRRPESTPHPSESLVARRGGTGFGQDRAKEILYDDRAAAAAALAAFVRDEVAIGGGIVFTRFRPGLCLRRGRDVEVTVQLTRKVTHRNPVVALDRAMDLPALYPKRVSMPDGLARARELMPGVGHGNWDVVAMANALPPAFRAVTGSLARGQGKLDPEARVAVRALDDTLARYERLGERGMIQEADAPAALETMRDAGRATYREGRELPNHLFRPMHDALVYVEAVALPRLVGPAPDIDAEALGLLAP